METTGQKNAATILHLSALSQYFFPFGNFIFPIVIWSAMKKNSPFIDANGRNAINFQLSVFIYTIVLALIAIPIFIVTLFQNVPFEVIANEEDFLLRNFSTENLTGIVVVALMAVLVFCVLKVAEFFLVIYAAVKAANGEAYNFPLAIPFIREEKIFETGTTNQSTDAHNQSANKTSSINHQSENDNQL